MSLGSPGGVIRSPAEGFDHRAFTGAGSLSFPLPSRPAREFEPKMALTYTPGSGSGVYGLDFSGPHHSIALQTAKKVPTYDDTDSFVYGDSPLVAGTSEERSVGNDTYRVQRFRPAYEESFDRIELWRSETETPFWRIVDHADTVWTFGRTEQARVSDPDDSDRIFEWLLEEVFDNKGNARAYKYKQEDSSGVGAEIFEQNRVQSANRYLSRVQYGNPTPVTPVDGGVRGFGSVDWLFEIVFDFGEYDISLGNDDPYTPTGPWPARPDPFSSYRAGFERRTHRLCRNVLLFQHFAELGSSPVLTEVLSLTYEESASVSALMAVESSGRRFRPGQPSGKRYAALSMPSTRLSYVTPPARGAWSRMLRRDGGTLAGVQRAPKYALVDLSGEGVAGVLYADETSVRYWDPVASDRDDGGIAYAATPPAPFPIQRSADGGDVTLMDVDGDGRPELVVTQTTPGYYANDVDGSWTPFEPFESMPTEFDTPTRQLVDLSGDGLSDILLLLDEERRFYPSLGTQGYGNARSLPQANHLPTAVTSTERIDVRLMDVMGVGTPQVVRLASGRIEVWPSLGHGAFGERILLGNAPKYGADVLPRQVLFANLTGLGPPDLVVAHADRVEIYENRGGNSFASEPRVVSLPVDYAVPWQLRASDVNGNGYDNLVLTTADPSPQHFSFDANGASKPWMLEVIDEQMGSTTTLKWQSSVRFYLRDKALGRPWLTSLPFPVQVVHTITRTDRLSNATRTSTFAYHDGYYDPIERTFRGFAMVERYDVAVDEPFNAGDWGAAATESHLERSITKTWFHTGAYPDNRSVEAALQSMGFHGDPDAYPMPSSVIEGDAEPDSTTLRTCAAALSGRMLREEVYGTEGADSDVPYSVVVSNYTQRVITPAGDQPYAVVYVHDREQVHYAYERVADDPVVTHDFTLLVDAWGNVERTCAIAYPRRPGRPGTVDDQTVMRVVCNTAEYVPPIDTPDVLLFGVVDEEVKYRITGLTPPTVDGRYYDFSSLAAQVDSALQGQTPGPTASRLTWKRYYYLGEQGTGPTRTIAPQALLKRVAVALLSDQSLATTFHDVPIDNGLASFVANDGGYDLDQDSGYWFDPGLEAAYADAAGFFLPKSVTDPLARSPRGPPGTTVTYAYDHYFLVQTGSTRTSSAADASPETDKVTFVDYTTVTPWRTVDANGNTSEVITDPLGRVIVTSRYGTQTEGGQVRAVGFEPLPLSDPGSWPMPSGPSDVLHDGGTYLRGAATFTYYDPFAYSRGGSPSQHTELRATSFPAPATPTVPHGAIEAELVFYDGFGRELEKKIRVPPGPAFVTDADGCLVRRDGAIVTEESATRYLVSGRVRYNVKAKPFQKFEPYYIDTWRFVDDSELGKLGVSITLSYDAVDRVVLVEYPREPFPDSFFTKTVRTAWSEDSFDRNDTVKESRYWKWFIDGNHPLPKYEHQALIKASAASGTPTTTVLNNVGQRIQTVDRLSTEPDGALVTQRWYDLLDRETSAADPRLGPAGIRNIVTEYAMSGQALKRVSVDAGTRYMLKNVVGKEAFTYDLRKTQTYRSYDGLHRLVIERIKGPVVNGEVVATRAIYGGSLDASGKTVHTDPSASNTIGKPIVHYDRAGRVSVSEYDIYGKPLLSARRFTEDPTAEPDWKATAGTWSKLFADLAPLLDSESFSSETEFDPLGRLIEVTDPVGNVTRNTFAVSGWLQSVAWSEKGGPPRSVIRDIEYDPKGRRSKLVVVDSAEAELYVTRYGYEPDTFRLSTIVTTRAGDGARLQDLTYWYDPEGNLTHVSDGAAPAQRVVAQNRTVTPDFDYTYDPLYRLITASGRSKAGLTQADVRSGGYGPFFGSAPHINDDAAVEPYSASYKYDRGGNLYELGFSSTSSTWKTKLQRENGSNRAWAVGDPGDELRQADPPFDANGNQTAIGGLSGLTWDHRNNLFMATLVERSGAPPDAEYYGYGFDGHRVRKVTSRQQGGHTVSTDVLYFGTLEIERTRTGSTVSREVQRARILDDEHRVGERMSWVKGTPPNGMRSPQWRFTLHNRLGSSMMQVDGAAAMISYEEYAPYGATVYAIGSGLAEVSLKMYRWVGKERDQATGLSYFGARYYLPWLGRFASADPAGDVDGLNLYAYSSNNPIRFVDRTGLCGEGEGSSKPRSSSTGRSGFFFGRRANQDRAPPPQSCTQCPKRAYNDPWIRDVLMGRMKSNKPSFLGQFFSGFFSFQAKRFQDKEGNVTPSSLVYPLVKPGIGVSLLLESFLTAREARWTPLKFSAGQIGLGMAQRGLAGVSLAFDIPKAIKDPNPWNIMGVAGSFAFLTEGYARILQSPLPHPRLTPGLGAKADLLKALSSAGKGEWYNVLPFMTATYTNTKELLHSVHHHGTSWKSLAEIAKGEFSLAKIARYQRGAGIGLIVGSVIGPWLSDLMKEHREP